MMRKKFVPPRMNGEILTKLESLKSKSLNSQIEGNISSNIQSNLLSNQANNQENNLSSLKIKESSIDQEEKKNNSIGTLNSVKKETTKTPNRKRTFTTAFISPEIKSKDSEDDFIPNTAMQYFSCMWTPMSKKKHKIYSDGFFIIEEKRILLLDDKGKSIAKEFTGHTKKFNTGEAYIIQSKEIELMEEIKPDDYISGRCFMNLTPGKSDKKIIKSLPTPLHASQKQIPIMNSKEQIVPEGCILLNPNHPKIGKNGEDIYDVWIDRFLCKQLHPHQVEGVQFMFECACGLREYNGNGGILADEMGLGKTLQAITLFHTLLQRGPNGTPVIKKAIIITNSSLVDNWKKEVKIWLGDQRCKPLVVTSKNSNNDPEKTINLFKTSKIHTLLIISYGLAMKYASEINKANPGLMICDEGHKLKNSEIKVVKSLKKITTPRRFILTGTPVQNNLQEFFSIIDFINPNVFGSDISMFKHLFENPISRAREPDANEQEKAIGLARSKELNAIVSQFMLRRTSDIIRKHLPPKTEMIIFSKLADIQRNIYQKLLKSEYVFNLFTNDDRSNALSYIQNLRKLLAHPSMLVNNDSVEDDEEEIENYKFESLDSELSMFKNTEVIETIHSGKIYLLVEMLKKMHEIGDNVVVVSYFTSILDLIQKVLDNLGFTWCRMDGKTSQSKRMEIVEKFNSSHNTSFCFLLSSKTGGAGHNLIGANRLIIFDCDWNPANDAQAMARIWRHGQKKNVFIYRFIACGTVEEKIFQRQLVKTGLSKMAVDEKHNKAAFSKEFLRELFQYTDDEYCETFEEEFEKENFMNVIKNKDPLLYEAGEKTKMLTYVKISNENDFSLSLESKINEEHDDEELDDFEYIEKQTKRRKIE